MEYDTPWSGTQADKLYLQSGQFTSTLKDSEDISSIDTITDTCWDGADTLWIGDWDKKLYRNSGQFTSTIKDSEAVVGWEASPTGISADDNNTPWCGAGDEKLYLQSGKFTSTLKDSELISGISIDPGGISWDGTDTPWCSYHAEKLYLQSGQFTATLKTSRDISGTAINPVGISWDGTNTPWIAGSTLYLQSGHFTSTVKDSEDISGFDSLGNGICTNDYDSRTTGTIDRSITDNLSITDSIDTEIIRVPLAVQVVIDTLTISDSVLGYTDYIPIDDSLIITDTISVFLNVINIFDYFEITDGAYQPTTYSKSIADTLTISDVISIARNVYMINDNLFIQQYVDLNDEIERTTYNTLPISDSVNVSTAQFAPKIIDILTITDSIVEKAPRVFVVEDTLTIDDTSDGIFQYNITIEDEFDILYIDTDNLIIYRMMDAVERHYTARRTPLNFLTIQQDVQVVNEITGATIDSASNNLTITDAADVAWSLGNSLTISDTINVTQGRLTKNDLSITDTVTFTRTINQQLIDPLILKSTINYKYIESYTHRKYSPFIGTSTDPNAPTPPSRTEPTTVKYNNVQLSYPIESPTHILTLDGPELSNRDLLGYTRINRETRGGTLVIFADPKWPKREQFNLQFIGLSETESQEILDFLRDSLGKQIRLRDWEGNVYVVVTLTPDNPITREGYCQNTINLNFENMSRHFEYSRTSTITLGQIASLAGSTYNKSFSSHITLGQVTAFTGSTYNKSLSNTISLSQTVLNQYPRSRTSTISFGQVISLAGSTYNLAFSNTVSLGQIVSQTISVFDRSLLDIIYFTYAATPAASTFSRSISSAISLGQSLVPVFVKPLSNTISLGQSVAQTGSTFNKSLSNTISFEHFKIIDYFLDHGSLLGLGDVADHVGYLLVDGSRDLTGNLAVDNAVTIDGRDISSDGQELDDTKNKVKVDAAATTGYLGVAFNDGVLRTDTSIAYADGGSFVTLSLDINSLDADTIAAADTLVFYDDGGTHNNKITFANLEGTLSHDNLADYDAAKHVTLPGTITNVLSDHDLAAHTTLGLVETITSNVTIYLDTGGDDGTGDGSSGDPWETLDKALDYLSDKLIASDATVIIEFGDGVHTRVATDVINHVNGDRIIIQGENTYALTMSGVVGAPGGGAGAWSVIIQVGANEADEAAVGDYLFIPYDVTGGNFFYTLPGCWEITNVDKNNHRLTITNTSAYGTAPSGAIIGTVTLMKTILFYNGCDGIIVAGGRNLGQLTKVALVGDGTHRGIYMSRGSIVLCTTPFGINNFNNGAVVTDAAFLSFRTCAICNCTVAGLYLYYGAADAVYGAYVGNAYGVRAVHGTSDLYLSTLSGNSNTGVIGERNSTLDCLQIKVAYNTTFGTYAYSNTYMRTTGSTWSLNGTNSSPLTNNLGNIESYIEN